jgi:glycosyltransferase involved in cell wall biosynthesis
MKLEDILSQKIELSDLLGEPQKTYQHPEKYKVVQLCMQDFGGAGKAAYRLNKGLQSIGVDSTMLVLNKKSGDPSVKILPVSYSGGILNALDAPAYNSPVWNEQTNKWHTLLSNYPNRPPGLEMFTDAESTVRLDLIREIGEADIINLHWVSGAMDFLNASSALKEKPVVWTLHDMNPFTGGCHYSAGCLKYKHSCGACPQLGSENTKDLSNHIWNQKSAAYKNLNIHVVALSRWLAGCAKESDLFSRFPIDHIPNGFPLNTFKPYPKDQIRKASNVSESAKLILFGADSLTNQRKGFAYLLEALNRFPLKSGYEYILVTFGNLSQGVKISSKYPVLNTGSISNEDQLALIYSAADLFVLPSLEDNLPNTVIEAMACGLPVVGFDIGGMPDMVSHKETGYLAKPKDIAGLVEGVNWIISSYENGVDFLGLCREKAEKEYALEKQAKAYETLYRQVLRNL